MLHRNTHLLLGKAGLLAALAVALAGCGPNAPPVAELPPPPVTVAQPCSGNVIDHDDYEGASPPSSRSRSAPASAGTWSR